MSETLNKLQSILSNQIGTSVTNIDLDKPLQEFGLDTTDLREFRFLIEQNYNIDMSTMFEGHYEEDDIDIAERDLKHETLRQIASWIDGWIDCPELHSRFKARPSKPRF